MKLSIIALVLTQASADQLDDLGLKNIFKAWLEKYDKVYQDAEELSHRVSIFADNHFMIEEHNNQVPPPSYTMAHNQFSDLTFSEFKDYNKLGEFSPGMIRPEMHDPSDRVSVKISRALKDLPDSVDWVEGGAVTPVKNQGMCGSCWAFSAIGAIEGARKVEYPDSDLVSLSEQQLIDCDQLDMGCNGGLMDNAFTFDEDSGGLCSEEDYPYAGRKHWLRGCLEEHGLCEDVPNTVTKTFIDVGGNETTTEDLMDALTDQPVSVAIQADQQAFQFYQSGVMDDLECGSQVDHGVLAVGYGTDEETGKDYWTIKNSWGETWGDSGYIKIGRNVDGEDELGICGILSFPSRPELA